MCVVGVVLYMLNTGVITQTHKNYQTQNLCSMKGVLYNSIGGVLPTKNTYCLVPPLVNVLTKGGVNSPRLKNYCNTRFCPLKGGTFFPDL